MVTRIYFVVYGGTVQGVGFRYFTRKKAQLHGITGWCRNTTDSNVEGEAQGGDEAMVKFLKDLHTGPQHAVVAKVTQEDRQTVEGEDSFAIRH